MQSASAPIRFADLAISPWRNGAGRKADIAVGGGWTLGFAWIDRDAPFSDYAGHDRTITLVDGAGFSLEFADQPTALVDAPFRPTRFDGGWPAQCRIIGGPCIVLNAMTERTRFRHTVEIRDASAGVVVENASADAVFVVALTGALDVETASGSTPLGRFDALRIEGVAHIRGAEAALVAAVRFANYR